MRRTNTEDAIDHGAPAIPTVPMDARSVGSTPEANGRMRAMPEATGLAAASGWWRASTPWEVF